jgi:hypothetical protein
VHKYKNVFVDGMEPVYFFPLTLTLSSIGGEGIEKEVWGYFLSPIGGRGQG